MTPRRAVTALWRRAAAGEDRGMMSLVMLVVVIGMGLGALLIPIVISQNRSTTHTDTRVQALHQAETGLNAALGRLRAATADGGVSGASSLLPCLSPTGTPLSWRQSGTGNGYDVTVQYFTSDPLTPLSATGALPTPLTCLAGIGPVDAGSSAAVPSFARITATGVDATVSGTATRTLSTTYAFSTDNAFSYAAGATTTTGGQIRLNPRTVLAQSQCLDAGPYPAVGSALTVQTCAAPTTPPVLAMKAQLFFYRGDTALRLANSVTPTTLYGLCVTSSTVSAAITLQACPSPGNAAVTQQWALNANSAFTGSGVNAQPVCLAVRAGGTDVTPTACAAGYDPAASWLPTPAVGAGSAGAVANQLVNLSQFGRCAQVTGQIVPSAPANPFLILYPCTQSARTSQVGWSEQFGYDPASGHWSTTSGGAAYCLTSPAAAGGYVTEIACSTTDARQRWTDYGTAAADQANAGQWSYAQRYTIVNQAGLCLSLSPTSGAADWYTAPGTTLQYSKLTADTCDGTARQKWNADPDPQSATLRNTGEK